MPCYDYVCEDCKIRMEEYREVDHRHDPLACPICNEQMQLKIMSGIFVLNRQKPGSFRHEKGKINGWDDRVATLRHMENSGDKKAYREFKKSIGPLYDMTLKYKKQTYA